MSEFDSDEASRLIAILEKPEALPNSEKSMREYIGKIRSEKYRSASADENLLLEIKKFREQKDTGGK